MALIPGSGRLWYNYDSFYHEYAALPVDYKDWLAVLSDAAVRTSKVLDQIVGDFCPDTTELVRVYPYVVTNIPEALLRSVSEAYAAATATYKRDLTDDDKIELCDTLGYWQGFEIDATAELVHVTVPGMVQGRDYTVRGDRLYILEPDQFRTATQVLPSVMVDEGILERVWGRPLCMGDAMLWLDKPAYRDVASLLFKVFYAGPKHLDFETGAKALTDMPSVEILDFRRAVLRGSFTQRYWRSGELGPFDFIVTRDFLSGHAHGDARKAALVDYATQLKASYTHFLSVDIARPVDAVHPNDDAELRHTWNPKEIPPCVIDAQVYVTDVGLLPDGSFTTDMVSTTCPDRDNVGLTLYSGMILATDMGYHTDTLYGDIYDTDIIEQVTTYEQLLTDTEVCTDEDPKWGTGPYPYVLRYKQPSCTDMGIPLDGSVRTDEAMTLEDFMTAANVPVTDDDKRGVLDVNLGPILRTDTFCFVRKVPGSDRYLPCKETDAVYGTVQITNHGSAFTPVP